MPIRSRTLQSKSYLKKKRTRLVGLSVIWLIAILALLVGIIFLLRLSVFQIRDTEVSGNKVIPTGEIATLAQTKLDGMYLNYIPRTNVFFYPRQEILDIIKSTYPRLSAVAVARRGRTLNISIAEREPSAVMCTTADGLDCFFVDTAAVPYAPASDFSDKMYIVIYPDVIDLVATGTAVSTTRNLLGTAFMSSDILRSILSFGKGMTKYGLPIQKILLQKDGDTVFVTATGTKVYIRARTSDGFDTAFANLGLFLDKIKIKTHPKLDSIDMRYGNSIFYK